MSTRLLIVEDSPTQATALLALLESAGYDVGVAASGDEALAAFQLLCETEGIIPALESSHAIAHTTRLAPTLPAGSLMLVNLSGRGDKDVQSVAEALR